MPRATTAYRPTPTNPNADTTRLADREASDGTDELLDDIDAVLEENELEVLRTFVQRGGQAVQVFLEDLVRGLLSFPTLPVLWPHALRKA